MKLSSLPVVKLPLVDLSTDPLDLLVMGLALRMKQLARTCPKFIELTHDRAFRIQIWVLRAKSSSITVKSRQPRAVQKKQILFCNLPTVSRALKP